MHIFLLGWILLAVPAGLSAQGASTFWMGGIQVNEPDKAAWAEALQQAGMNTVSVTVYAKQGDWDSAELWWEAEEPDVLAEIRAAKAAGLQVVLIPRVALDHAYPRNHFLWHGMIMPRDPAVMRAWFSKYTEFLLQWAAIAEAEGVDLFGIGSEMNALTRTRPGDRRSYRRLWKDWYWYHKLYGKRLLRFRDRIDEQQLWVRGRDNFPSLEDYLQASFRANVDWGRQVYLRDAPDHVEALNARREALDQNWREVIRAVRTIYSGKLTYAANFDNYQEVSFWDALDEIGINAYFPLMAGMQASSADAAARTEMRSNWDQVLAGIEAFRAEQHLEQGVVFTEIGYTFRCNATVAPWEHAEFCLVRKGGKDQLIVWREQPIDYTYRMEALQSLKTSLEARGDFPLDGMLFWKLSTQLSHREIEPFVICIGKDSQDPVLPVLQHW